MVKRILFLLSAILGVRTVSAQTKASELAKSEKIQFEKPRPGSAGEVKIVDKLKESGVKVKESKSADGQVCNGGCDPISK